MRLIGSLRSFALVAAAIVLIPLLAGCAPAPATQAPASTAQPAAAPAATQPAATPVPTAAEQPSATGLEGQWEGPLKVAGQTLDMVVRFSGSGSALKGTLDVPSQAAKDIPLSNVNISQDGSKVHFEAFSGARLATYDGELQADGSLSGVFEQAGFKGTLAMQRVAAQPIAVLPYHQEEVSYKNGAITMACTLSTPPAGAPFPAVILITGSGPKNRKENEFHRECGADIQAAIRAYHIAFGALLATDKRPEQAESFHAQRLQSGPLVRHQRQKPLLILYGLTHGSPPVLAWLRIMVPTRR